MQMDSSYVGAYAGQGFGSDVVHSNGAFEFSLWSTVHVASDSLRPMFLSFGVNWIPLLLMVGLWLVFRMMMPPPFDIEIKKSRAWECVVC